MTMTQRDKKLLYALVVMVVLALGMFLLVLPAVNGYRDTRQQLATANAEYDKRQVIINNANVTQASIVELKQKINAETAGYPKVMHNLELDRLHTLRALMSKWKPIQLAMEPMAALAISPFGTSTADTTAADTTTTDTAATDTDSEMVEPVVTGNTAWLAASGITMKADARQSEAIALINTIVTSPHEQLRSLKLTPAEAEVVLDANGEPIVSTVSDDPYVTIELAINQFYALDQQVPELDLFGASYQ